MADFDRKLEVCERAGQLARGWADPLLALETEVVKSHIRLAKGVYQVAKLVALGELSRVEEQRGLSLALQALRRAGDENAAAICAWRKALGPEPWHYRVHDALKATAATVREICIYAEERYLYLLDAPSAEGYRP